MNIIFVTIMVILSFASTSMAYWAPSPISWFVEKSNAILIGTPQEVPEVKFFGSNLSEDERAVVHTYTSRVYVWEVLYGKVEQEYIDIRVPYKLNVICPRALRLRKGQTEIFFLKNTETEGLYEPVVGHDFDRIAEGRIYKVSDDGSTNVGAVKSSPGKPWIVSYWDFEKNSQKVARKPKVVPITVARQRIRELIVHRKNQDIQMILSYNRQGSFFEPLEVTVTITNRSKNDIQAAFSLQDECFLVRFDLTKDSGTNVKLYTRKEIFCGTGVRNRTISAGQSVTEKWDLRKLSGEPLRPGHYTISAVLLRDSPSGRYLPVSCSVPSELIIIGLKLSNLQVKLLANKILENTPERIHFEKGTKFEWVLLSEQIKENPEILNKEVEDRLKKKYNKIYYKKDDVPEEMKIKYKDALAGYKKGFLFLYKVIFEGKDTVKVEYYDWVGNQAASGYWKKYKWTGKDWEIIEKSGLLVS